MNLYIFSSFFQFSNGGGAFLAGKGIKNDKQKAAILGSVAGAQHVRLMAKHYGVPVVLHSGEGPSHFLSKGLCSSHNQFEKL